jgi:hypothetical protein
MNMNKPPDETLKQGRNRSWLLVKLWLKYLIGSWLFRRDSLYQLLTTNWVPPNVPGICSLSSDEKCMWSWFFHHWIELKILRLSIQFETLRNQFQVHFRATHSLRTLIKVDRKVYVTQLAYTLKKNYFTEPRKKVLEIWKSVQMP